MKIRIFLAVSFTVLIIGCSSNPHFMNPKVERALGDSILHSIRDVQSMTYWSPSFGHGLKIEVRAPGDPNEYTRDLVSEMNGAAMVFAALAKSDLSIEWDFVEVQYTVDYGKMPPMSKHIVGVVEVLIQRETIVRLRKQHLPASEYSQYWILLRGFKDQPDSNKLLKW